MAIPLPASDPARAALQKGDEVLLRLDALTKQPGVEPQAAEVTPPAVQEVAAIPELTLDQKLKELADAMNAAIDAQNEQEIRRLAQNGRDAARAERAHREQMVQDAQDYFDEALKEYGESAPETLKAAGEVQNWKKSLLPDEFIAENDAYFDAATYIEHLHDADQPAPAAVEPEKEPATLDELLQALDMAEASLKKRIEEIKAKKKDVAAQLVEERIAKLKEGVGA